jgi:hypothetical protein
MGSGVQKVGLTAEGPKHRHIHVQDDRLGRLLGERLLGSEFEQLVTDELAAVNGEAADLIEGPSAVGVGQGQVVQDAGDVEQFFVNSYDVTPYRPRPHRPKSQRPSMVRLRCPLVGAGGN